MKKNNTILKKLLALSLIAALFSCNNAEGNKEETVKTADSTVSATPTPAPAPAFTPFDVLVISHTVKDYDKWRPAFDTDATARKTGGMEDMVVGRGIDNSNNIIIAMKVSDVQKARDFVADPRLKDVMGKAGVTSKPGIEFFRAIRYNPDSKEKQWVVVTHRVKDFDAWVKVYDGEGTAQRASEGMVDVALARGIEDPNMVQIVFDITDMAKAKAAITSDAKKKLMMSAGVEGMPKIEFYKTAE